MLFSEIIGNQNVKQRFVQSVSENRIPHAQLISGREGVGKLRLAIAYAQYISCQNRSQSDACGLCPSCVKFAKLAHPDLHFVFPYAKPEGSSKTWICDDFILQFREMILKNTYFSIDDWQNFAFGDSKKVAYIYENESSEIIRKLNVKSYESEYKTMIIWLPEKMYGDIGANKILKILEEPPAKTVFLLVSNQPNLLLPTIISRTQPIVVQPLTETEITEALHVMPSLPPEEAQRIAHIAAGSALEAFRIAADDEENALNLQRFTALMRTAYGVGAESLSAQKKFEKLKEMRIWAEEMADTTLGRERQKKFLQYAQKMVRENYFFNLCQPSLNYLTTAEEDFARNFARFITEKNVEQITAELSLAERQINQNVNAKMIFFDLALKMIVCLKGK